MIDSDKNPAPKSSEVDKLDQQLVIVAAAIKPIVEGRHSYFKRPHKANDAHGRAVETELTNGEWVQDMLKMAHEELSAGELKHQGHITVFKDIESRSGSSEAYDNNRLVENIYGVFSEKAFGRVDDYYGLIQAAEALADEGIVVKESATYEWETTDGPAAAILNQQGDLTGIQLQATPNIFVNFELGIFGQPDKPSDKETSVRLVIEPQLQA